MPQPNTVLLISEGIATISCLLSWRAAAHAQKACKWRDEWKQRYEATASQLAVQENRFCYHHVHHPMAKNMGELMEWVVENKDDPDIKYQIEFSNTKGGYGYSGSEVVSIWISNPSKAVMFKLRFGGE